MVEFKPNPLCTYKYMYNELFDEMLHDRIDSIETYRKLILNDLFFVLFFIVHPFNPKCEYTVNHPFIVDACREVEDGPVDFTLDVWSRFHYKAVSLSEPVPTLHGWKAHGELEVGDIVYGVDGELTNVVAKTEVYNDADCYRVELEDGYNIVVSGDHLWTVNLPDKSRIPGAGPSKRKSWKTVTINTRKLMSQVNLSKHVSSRKYPTVVVAQPVYKPYVNLPLDPYVLGVWLGDGTVGLPTITAGKEDAVNIGVLLQQCGVETDGTDRGNCFNIYMEKGTKGTPNPVTTALRSLDIFEKKSIPTMYMHSHEDQRWALLQGLMDTDGNCHKEHGQCVFVSANSQFADSVFDLCQSLGLKPTIHEQYGVYNGERRPFYQVQFRGFAEKSPFRLERKRKLLMPKSKYRDLKGPTRRVTDVVTVPSIPVSCIQVDSPDGLYLVGRNYIPTHNSSIITIAETIQYIARSPELSTGILSYASVPAKKFLFSIREVCENEKLLYTCFPGIFWDDPKKEAPLWSIDAGIILKRESNRKEPTVSAYGLTEGMPSGSHFERRIYDDIITEDIADSIDVMEKVKDKYDSSQNLTTDGGTHRVVGTYYHHNDPLNYIKDKKSIGNAEESAYLLRLKPATADGTINGKPVLLTQRTYDNLKLTSTFSCQQLLDPTPVGIRRLDSTLFQDVEPEFIPSNLYKFLIVDPAGNDTGKRLRDDWAIGVLGVEPTVDDMGLSRVFLLDALIEPLREDEAPNEVVNMYIRNYPIRQIGIEKVALSTTELHVSQALEKKHIYVSVDNNTLVILRPSGRKKEKRIERGLAAPLYHSKLFMSKSVPVVYRDKIRLQSDTFPYGIDDDGLDMWSYLYDMITNLRFIVMDEEDQKPEPRRVGRNATTGY